MATPHIHTTVANNTTYVACLTVRGIDGVLAAVGAAGAMGYGYMRITIDSVLVADDFLVGSNVATASANTGLGVALPFSQGFQIEIRDSPTASAITRFWIAYVTSHSPLMEEPERYVRRMANVDYLFERARHRGPGDAEYTIERLLAPNRWADVEVDHDVVRETDSVAGSMALSTLYGDDPSTDDSLPLHVRIPGFSTVLTSTFVSVVDERGSFEIPVAGLPRAVELEVITASPNRANVPARFIVR